MKWIKNTDRSPIEDGRYFVIDDEGYRSIYVWRKDRWLMDAGCYQEELREDHEDFEWLDMIELKEMGIE
jgi:hypothetical protein